MPKEPAAKCCEHASNEGCWECGKKLGAAHSIRSTKHAGQGRLCRSPKCAAQHKEPALWRANIRPDEKQYALALREKIFGVGWGVDGGKKGLDWSQYLALAEPKYHEREKAWEKQTGLIHHGMAIGDLVWIFDSTRRPGDFYLGRIQSEWAYRHEFDKDRLPNVRDCNWIEVPREEVPGDLYICPTTFIQKKHDGLREYSKSLYNRLTKSQQYPVSIDHDGAIWRYLSHSDCEDIVGIFLQHEYRLYIVPSTCKKSTQDYEFMMTNATDAAGESSAALQVKKGQGDLHMPDYADEKLHVYLFTSDGKCTGWKPENVTQISVAKIESFMRTKRDLFPKTAQFWIDRFLNRENFRAVRT